MDDTIDLWTPGYQVLSMRARKAIRRYGLTRRTLTGSLLHLKGVGPTTERELKNYGKCLRRIRRRG